MLKKISLMLMSVCMLIPSAVFAKENSCSRYSGTNVETQDYQYWALSKNTYLKDCGDGTLLRFQSDALVNFYTAEYYSDDYTLLRTVRIKEELPIFGAFYATADNYFVISGNENRSESAKVEVFRITKYDKNWNKIKSVGLKDCNTTNPFDAGTTSVDDSGGYLIIRTSHEMYADSNGTNHEANVTIQVDISSMKIIDYITKVSNNNNGYVSHSFNQFVKINDDSIVAVDHGDAVPRSICLMEYPTKISSGKFTTKEVKTTDILKFGGNSGDNYTGASVGGFEISSSSYLTAYNQIEYSGYDWTLSRGNRTVTVTNGIDELKTYQIKEGAESRNVYVAVKSKSGSKVSLKKISKCADYKTASTPHLVKISSKRFLVLWSEFSVVEFSTVLDSAQFRNYYYIVPDNKVYYTEVNADGEQQGDIYSFKGNLSDCQPVLFNGNIVWNTWTNNENKFYCIDKSDISKREIKKLGYTHSSEAEGKLLKLPTFEEGGMMEYTCDFCGETYTEALPKLQGIMGDVNADGAVDIRDAVIIQKYIVHCKTDIDIGLADYDGDGRITIRDVTRIQKHIAGLI